MDHLIQKFNKLSSKHKNYVVIALFAVLILTFYGNTLGNGFIFDDIPHIEQNEYTHSFKYLPKTVTSCLNEFFIDCKSASYPHYRPTNYLSFLLTYQISSQPWIFHFVNLLYFFIAAALLFILAKLLTKKFLIAFLATLLFIIHPINSEVVAVISLVPDLILFIFIALSLIFYIRYRQKFFSGKFLLVYLFYFLALLSKETAIVLPLMILSIDLFFFKKSPSQFLRPDMRTIYFLFAIPTAIYFFMRVSVSGMAFGASTAKFSFLEGVHARITLFSDYLAKIFYPYPLSNFYPFERSINFLTFDFLISFFVVIIFFVTIFFFIKRKKNIFALSLGWFALFLSPVILPLVGEPDHMFVDRYVVVPGIGLYFIAAYAFSYGFSYSKFSKYFTLFVLFLIIVVSWFVVFPRNQEWNDPYALIQSSLRHFPNAHAVRHAAALSFFNQGNLESARTQFEYLIENAPDWPDITMAYKGLGDYYIATGDKETALTYYEQSAQLGTSPRDYVPHNLAGLLYMEQEEPLLAFTYFCTSASLFPTDQNQSNFNAALSQLDEQYIQTSTLKEAIKEQFTPIPEGNARYAGQQCNTKTCQWGIALNPQTLQVLAPPLMMIHTQRGVPIEITNSGFDQTQAVVILETDVQYEDEELTFTFPTCSRTYYEVSTE